MIKDYTKLWTAVLPQPPLTTEFSHFLLQKSEIVAKFAFRIVGNFKQEQIWWHRTVTPITWVAETGESQTQGGLPRQRRETLSQNV